MLPRLLSRRPRVQRLDDRVVPAIVIVNVFDSDYSINPSGMTIEDAEIDLGDTVRWVWDPNNFAPHSVTSASGQTESFNSGLAGSPFQFDHTFTNVGTFGYYCQLHGFDAGGGQGAGMAGTITVANPPGPPQVLGVDINDGDAQRSRVTQVRVDFDQLVTTPAGGEAFSLKRNGDDAPVTLSAVIINDTATHVTLTFTGGAVESGAGIIPPLSLQDGRYTLSIDASKVSNANGSLDGDGNGTGGDNYVLASAPPADPATNIFRFFGDNDGDGDNDGVDFLAFRDTSGLSNGDPGFNSNFDFDNDGDVDAADFLRYRDRFGTSV